MAKNTPVVKDWFLLGLLTGIGSSLAKSLIAMAADRVGAPAKRYDSLAGNLMMGRRPKFGGLVKGGLKTPGDKLLGFVADTVAGGAFGVALSYTYAHTPPGNEVVKGALGGAVLGSVSLATGRQMGVAGFADMKAGDAATHLALSTFFGGLEGMVIGRYASRLVPQSHPVLVKDVTDKEFEAGGLRYGSVAGAHVHRLWRTRAEEPTRPLDGGLEPTVE